MSTRPTMQTFIDDNRPELVTIIRGQTRIGTDTLDDNEIEDWILNFEPLYLLATNAGVDV